MIGWMSTITIALGCALIVLGVTGYVLTGGLSPTALIPAAFGIALAIAGLAARDDRRRKHAMHAAVVVALLGLLGSLRGLRGIDELIAGNAERPAAVISQLTMAVLCGIYLVLAINSFVAARRNRAS
jgi:thiol:disulfide interchange protein